MEYIDFVAYIRAVKDAFSLSGAGIHVTNKEIDDFKTEYVEDMLRELDKGD